MSELNEMGCEQFADVAAELALGVLTGRERADALAHLDGCDACRATVRQLTLTAEELLGLLPASEPPPGFETRVMERIGLGAPRATRSRRRFSWIPASRTRQLLAAAAVAVALVGAGLGGWSLRPAGTQVAQIPLSSAAFVSADSQTTGRIFVYDASPGWVYMTVDTEAANGTVICQVMGADGRVTTIGSFPLNNGYGSWGSAIPAHIGPIAGARLVAPGGAVLATADFQPQLMPYPGPHAYGLGGL
jgi:anti-sigma-K factor RskA